MPFQIQTMLYGISPRHRSALNEAIKATKDLNAFSRSCSTASNLASSLLYRRNAKRALLWGAEKGNVHTVHNALREGAKVDELGMWGFTPLLLATHNGHTDVMRSLLDSGADVNVQTTYGWTPLEVALRLSDSGTRETASSMLLQSGARLSHDNEGRTAFHWAVEARDDTTIKLLSSFGVDIESRDTRGRTALHFAVSLQNHEDTVRVLVDCGADVVSKDREGRATLDLAAETFQTELVKFFNEQRFMHRV